MSFLKIECGCYKMYINRGMKFPHVLLREHFPLRMEESIYNKKQAIEECNSVELNAFPCVRIRSPSMSSKSYKIQIQHSLPR